MMWKVHFSFGRLHVRTTKLCAGVISRWAAVLVSLLIWLHLQDWMHECAVEQVNLKCPCLVIAGEKDLSWSVEAMREVSKSIGAKKFVVMRNVAHHPPFENAPMFNEIVHDFFAEFE